jgi:predicted GNAT superfamily acetyltransferase
MSQPDQLTYRELTSQEDHDQCVDLQRATWGDDFRELVSPALLLVARKLGGILLGAFEPDGRLVGFVFGLTGLQQGEPVHWSHMLAVREDLRSRGIGRRLKELQRAHVAALGVQHIQWTFDPLVARNAHLNLDRLGVRVLEYVEHMYGESPVSVMDSVIGTDRFVVEWPTRAASPAGRAEPAADAAIVSLGSEAESDLPGLAEVLIEIPADIQKLKSERPEEAVAWRHTTRRALQHYLAAGYAVVGFAAGRYLLRRDEGTGA